MQGKVEGYTLTGTHRHVSTYDRDESEPLLKSLHTDPRYAAFLKKINLPN